MQEIHLDIDGEKVNATEGMTVLQAAQNAGIHIPAFCHHEKLQPYGACRMCLVEIEAGGEKRVVASCLYPAEENLVVRTTTERIRRIRKMVLAMFLAIAPESKLLKDLAQEYGAKGVFLTPKPSFCILCGLCVRYCREVKKKNALGFVGRGTKREINFIPEIALKECDQCKECFSLCPTSAVQAQFMLTQALGNTMTSFAGKVQSL